MLQKLYKILLIATASILLICFFVFYFRDALPDNYLRISSTNSTVGFLIYYPVSFLALVEYYLGIWLLFPFVCYAMTYAFIISKRDWIKDACLFPMYLMFFSTLSVYLFPITVGEGHQFFVRADLPIAYKIASIILTLPIILIILFGNFLQLYQEIIHSFKKITVYLFSHLHKKNHTTLKRDNHVIKRVTPATVVKSQESDEIDESENGSDFDDESSEVLSESPDHDANIEDIDFNDLPSESKEPQEDSQVAEAIEHSLVQPTKKRLAPSKKSSDDTQYYKVVDSIGDITGEKSYKDPDDEYFETIVQRIDDKLQEFKIDARVINILKGPVVDTFELSLGAGVRISKITVLEEDLSLALYGAPVRMVYPITGRSTVGIEVPRNPRETIFLDQIFNSKEFKKTKHALPVAMGKDAFGEAYVVDLAAMPHMLVAGSTGSGKSVFLNTLLLSLLVKKSPAQMKLILIDPKQLELALYAKLPHLLMPVITDPKRAMLSLMWACEEMERRYSILKEFSVRNIDGFNEKLKRATPDLLMSISKFYEDGGPYELPYMVIIVDEFADLILTKAGKEIENNICRLAAKARAAGIHLVIATQRPSVDVITGLIKSNFPTRISFRVTTGTDSRTILSAQGAEKLLGKGDMLYKAGVEMKRLHSAFVDEDEVGTVTEKLSTINQEFDDRALNFLEEGGPSEQDPFSFGSHLTSTLNEGEDNDDLYDEAVGIVTELRAASASMLQRRLKIGYNRAANLIDMMERRGVVGPAQGAKPRKVLNSMDEN